ncbi:MAG: hypothetical protein ACF8PN_08160 [Phycisphaerales bacterium]
MSDLAADLTLPEERPVDPGDILDRLHSAQVDLDLAFAAVAAAKAIEAKRRAEAFNHHIVDGQSVSGADKLARAATVEQAIYAIDAEASLARLEAQVGYYRFLLEHLPGGDDA